MLNENVTDVMNNEDNTGKFNTMKVLQIVIASLGIITNITVVAVFVNDRTMRRKIPNLCIMNHVGIFLHFSYLQIKKYWIYK